MTQILSLDGRSSRISAGSSFLKKTCGDQIAMIKQKNFSQIQRTRDFSLSTLTLHRRMTLDRGHEPTKTRVVPQTRQCPIYGNVTRIRL
jgi:hypothetical protein